MDKQAITREDKLASYHPKSGSINIFDNTKKLVLLEAELVINNNKI